MNVDYTRQWVCIYVCYIINETETRENGVKQNTGLSKFGHNSIQEEPEKVLQLAEVNRE